MNTEDLVAMSVGDLLPMVEASTGPDRELDKAIWMKLVFDPELAKSGDGYLKLVGSGYPAYTASLDAALALAERMRPANGLMLAVSGPWHYAPHHPKAGQLIWRADLHEDFEEYYAADLESAGATPALALLAALLKALISVDTAPPEVTK